MNIYIKQQQLNVGNIDIIAVSSSSTFQIGDNDQVILYAIAEDVPDSIQIGPFPQYARGESLDEQRNRRIPSTSKRR